MLAVGGLSSSQLTKLLLPVGTIFQLLEGTVLMAMGLDLEAWLRSPLAMGKK